LIDTLIIAGITALGGLLVLIFVVTVDRARKWYDALIARYRRRKGNSRG
jgi:hypothetical protein